VKPAFRSRPSAGFSTSPRWSQMKRLESALGHPAAWVFTAQRGAQPGAAPHQYAGRAARIGRLLIFCIGGGRRGRSALRAGFSLLIATPGHLLKGRAPGPGAFQHRWVADCGVQLEKEPVLVLSGRLPDDQPVPASAALAAYSAGFVENKKGALKWSSIDPRAWHVADRVFTRAAGNYDSYWREAGYRRR
jgi:hypothetical protein